VLTTIALGCDVTASVRNPGNTDGTRYPSQRVYGPYIHPVPLCPFRDTGLGLFSAEPPTF
jgi:hypothetical protein